MIRLTLPFPPSVNHMYPSGRNGRRFLSKAGAKFVQLVSVCVHMVRFDLTRGVHRHCPKPGFVLSAQSLPLTCRLGLRLVLNVPDKRKRDISNCIKAVEDSLTKAGVWLDDSQIDKLIVERGVQTKGGDCWVMIWDLDTECGP